MTHLGTISTLWRFPVKAMMGEQLNAARVTTAGLAGDRAYALIDDDGRICTPKIIRKWGPIFQSRARYLEEPESSDDPPPAEITLPDGERIFTNDPGAEERLSDLVGFPARLITEAPMPLKLESPPLGAVPESEDGPTVDFPVPNRFFDLGSLHLLTTGTLEKLRELSPGTTFDARRFRPNFIVSTDGQTGFVENDWPGKMIAIGDDVLIKVMMPTIRCVVTTRAQDDLPNDPAVLKTAAAHNNANVGVYAMVERGGIVRRGDELSVLD
ncbi:MAG TPA: MOSC N-terminal beta barrel domain-containing protein [Dehalococcoidia bacterium]|nr:MOSC N-terminal beta barrel domain-containing protein [Dehalococcoidia bacterium]